MVELNAEKIFDISDLLPAVELELGLLQNPEEKILGEPQPSNFYYLASADKIEIYQHPNMGVGNGNIVGFVNYLSEHDLVVVKSAERKYDESMLRLARDIEKIARELGKKATETFGPIFRVNFLHAPKTPYLNVDRKTRGYGRDQILKE